MAISDASSRVSSSLIPWLGQIEGLVDGVQLREKHLADREQLELAVRCRSATGSMLLMNGRPDIALAAGCEGVHLTSTGLPTQAVRAAFGDRLLIGRSTHHPDEVLAARQDGADYVVFGPVFPTPSKAAYGSPPGLPGLRQATQHGLPVIAIGGIGPEQMPVVASAGASGVAGIRAFQDLTQLNAMAAIAHRLWPESTPANSPIS